MMIMVRKSALLLHPRATIISMQTKTPFVVRLQNERPTHRAESKICDGIWQLFNAVLSVSISIFRSRQHEMKTAPDLSFIMPHKELI